MDFEHTLQIEADVQPVGPKIAVEKGYWEQVGNAYSQSKLVDYESSAKGAYNLEMDNTVDALDIEDSHKESIKNYKKRTKISRLDEEVEKKFNVGDWGYDYETNTVIMHNDSGKELYRYLPDTDETLKGYALSRIHDGLDEKTIKQRVYTATLKKFIEYETELQKDDFTDNFGSQVLGNIGAYVTDPLGAMTLTAEIATLRAVNPLTMGKYALKVAKIVKKRKLMSRHKEFAASQGMDPKMGIRAEKEIAEMDLKADHDLAKKQLMVGTGLEAGIGMASEAYLQSLSFDFKHNVLPDYTVSDAVVSVAGVGIANGLMGGVAIRVMERDRLSNKIIKRKFQDIEDTYDDALKKIEELEAKTIADEAQSKRDDIITAMFEEARINKVKKGDYMLEDSKTRNMGGERFEAGEGSYNKGELSSEDIARARTGQMSRYKDESVNGSYNKQTWREFEVDLTRQGFTKEEAKNIINNVYSLSGKKREQVLRDMGIELK